jgi:3-(3-hydroxy-phenyl)propionate hydroxylase
LNLDSGAPAAFDAGPAPGAVLPECPLTLQPPGAAPQHAHLTDLLVSAAPGFVALCFSDGAAAPAATAESVLASLSAALAQRGVAFSAIGISRQSGHANAWDHTGRLFPMYGAGNGSVYLVRPDGHVLARWKALTIETLAQRLQTTIDATLNPPALP